MKGIEGNGIHEDTVDTLYMIANDYTLFLLIVLEMISLLFFNILLMIIIKINEAISGAIVDVLINIPIFFVHLILFYPQKIQNLEKSIHLSERNGHYGVI
jgi:hypothetical protein